MPGSIPFIPGGFIPTQPGAAAGGGGGGGTAITAIAAGNVTATVMGPKVVFVDANAVSFGVVGGSWITASVDVGLLETPFGASAGTQSVSTGTLVFANSNGVSFGMSGSSQITASFAGAAETPFGLSAGTQSVSTGTLVFSNSNGVTFGMSGSSRVTASVAAETPFGLSAGTQSVSTGTLVFSNSNNVSFGMSGSSRITASASFPAETPFGVSAGTQSVSTGTLVFSNSNNVSFGMSGSSRVTASFSETPFGLSAGTQSISTGTLVFSNSNGMTFGMSGSSRVTASFDAIKSISGGTTRLTNGEAVFSNSNGVSFGVNGNTITASVATAAGALTLSLWENGCLPAASLLGGAGGAGAVYLAGRAALQRMSIPVQISATRMDLALGNPTVASLTYSVNIHMFTMAGSSASRASSTSFSVAISNGAVTAVSAALGTWSITPGDYLLWLGINQAGGSSGAFVGQSAQFFGSTPYFADGSFSQTATGSFQISDVNGYAGTNAQGRPFARFIGTF